MLTIEIKINGNLKKKITIINIGDAGIIKHLYPDDYRYYKVSGLKKKIGHCRSTGYMRLVKRVIEELQ